jgi:hypothetical protein
MFQQLAHLSSWLIAINKWVSHTPSIIPSGNNKHIFIRELAIFYQQLVKLYWLYAVIDPGTFFIFFKN